MTAPAPTVLHFVAEWLPPSEQFVYDLVTNLAHPGAVVSAGRPHGTERFPHPGLRTLAPVERWVRPARLRPAAMAGALQALARQERAAVVHAHHGYRTELLAPVLRRRRLPFVLSVHGHDVTGYLDQRPDPYRAVSPLVSAVVVPSRFVVPLVERAGLPADRVRVLPSGIDGRYFVPTALPEGDPVALFVGRFVAKKGLDVLAEAWPAVQARLPRARLRILGFGPLEALARAIPGRVEVATGPDRRAVRDAMRAATAVVTPSHAACDDAVETLLMVNVEAQASGRPVVSTWHGGIPEYVVHGQTGLLVPESDPAALADALVRVLGDRELATRLGEAGPATAAALDVRRTAGAVDRLYDELLAERAATPAAG
ncbi:MAG: glycosyltransferase family 4 protein [Acidobacteriota bacterium]|nr:glycosyltransferase family 4 protein [Acidobacteriota bacterium]